MVQSILFHIDGIFLPLDKQNNHMYINQQIYQFLPGLFENLTKHGLRIYVVSALIEQEINNFMNNGTLQDHVVAFASIYPENNSVSYDYLLDQWNITAEDAIALLPSNHAIDHMKSLYIPTIGYLNDFYPADSLSNSTFLLEGFDEVDYTFIEYVYNYYHGLPQVIARTNRLIIQELTVPDIDQLYPIANHKDIKDKIEDMTGLLEEEKEKMSAYIASIYRFYGIGLWGIFLSDTQQLIGRAGVEYKHLDCTDLYELGFYISPYFQGNGYAGECLEGILNFCFHNLELPSIVAFVELHNVNSRKLLLKIGMKFDCIVIRNQKQVHKYIIHNPNIIE